MQHYFYALIIKVMSKVFNCRLSVARCWSHSAYVKWGGGIMLTVKQIIFVSVFVFVVTALVSCGSKENNQSDEQTQEHKSDGTNGNWW